jgi:benzoyl-CoA reductase subunit D
MAGRFARLLAALIPQGAVFVSGGLGMDEGLLDALRESLGKMMPKGAPPVVTHELGMHAGAIGAALWGAYRHRKLGMEGAAWTSSKTAAA